MNGKDNPTMPALVNFLAAFAMCVCSPAALDARVVQLCSQEKVFQALQRARHPPHPASAGYKERSLLTHDSLHNNSPMFLHTSSYLAA
jgi:hypothetical protein